MKVKEIMNSFQASSLSAEEMKSLTGGDGIIIVGDDEEETPVKYCYVEGECVFAICKSDAQCNHWGAPGVCR